jgi:signal transduction histidine kinase
MSTEPKKARDAGDLQDLLTGMEEEIEIAAVTNEIHLETEGKLRRDRDYAESVIDTVHEPLLVLDRDLRVENASRSFYETFGVTAQATIGEFLYDLGNGEWDIPGLRHLLETVLPEQSTFRDFEVTHDFPLLGRRVMLLNGRTIVPPTDDTQRVLLAIEDVTERKRIQDDLLRSNEELQSFSYIAAHDLRAPANTALRSLQLLARRVTGKLDQEESSILTEAVESIKRLSALMRDLLALNHAGIVPQQPKLIPIEEPLEIALANLAHHLSESGATVTRSELPTLMADRTQLAMVFQNLIGNAIKYRREEDLQIGIEVVREGATWRFAISDNGQGFEPQNASRIFEPFKRLHGVKVPGSGIGLATCKRTVERFGGTIWADSIPGEGSTFYFTLPALKEQS